MSTEQTTETLHLQLRVPDLLRWKEQIDEHERNLAAYILRRKGASDHLVGRLRSLQLIRDELAHVLGGRA